MNTSRKVFVATGASQGVGAEVVKAFRKRGYRIVAISRSIKPSDDENILNDDENILNIAGDIGNPATARHVISAGVTRFGRIDRLVDNAGSAASTAFFMCRRGSTAASRVRRYSAGWK